LQQYSKKVNEEKQRGYLLKTENSVGGEGWMDLGELKVIKCDFLCGG